MVRFLQTAKKQGKLPASRPARRRTKTKGTESGHNQYIDRQRNLSLLGFESYEAYLLSDVWPEIRDRILAKHPQCQICHGKPAYTAHHTSYALAVLAGFDDSGLVSSCPGCHQAIEFRNGNKLLGATAIHERLKQRAGNRVSKKKGKQLAKDSWRRCRCCQQQRRGLGREDICLPCFRLHGPKVHEKAAAHEERTIRTFQAKQAARAAALLELRP